MRIIFYLFYELFISMLNITSSLVSLQDGNTPLHIASADGHEAVVEVLLKAGTDHSISNNVRNVLYVL